MTRKRKAPIRGGPSSGAVRPSRPPWCATPRARTKKLRKRRLLIGLVTFLVVGVGMGAYIGLQSRKTAEELAEQEAEGSEVDIKKEADRLLNELWRMEDLERAPRR